MDRVAVFVDAGYLFAQGSKEMCGRKLLRGEISLDHQALIRALKDFAERISKLPLLRIYWYDGTSQGPTSQHNTLADQADMKVRLGFVNSAGQQKGVDSLIVTDMISLARNRAMADCVLLSGDEDLRVGVQQAQEYGVRVHLLLHVSRRPPWTKDHPAGAVIRDPNPRELSATGSAPPIAGRVPSAGAFSPPR